MSEPMTKTEAVLRDLIDHAKVFSVESAQEGLDVDARLWKRYADALTSLMETHVLVPKTDVDEIIQALLLQRNFSQLKALRTEYEVEWCEAAEGQQAIVDRLRTAKEDNRGK